MSNHVSPEQHDGQPLDATAALRNMAESAGYANHVLAGDGSYTPDDAVCASAATVAAVCEILGRLKPFLGEAWRMAQADVSNIAQEDPNSEARQPPHQVQVAFSGRDEVIEIVLD